MSNQTYKYFNVTVNIDSLMQCFPTNSLVVQLQFAYFSDKLYKIIANNTNLLELNGRRADLLPERNNQNGEPNQNTTIVAGKAVTEENQPKSANCFIDAKYFGGKRTAERQKDRQRRHQKALPHQNVSQWSRMQTEIHVQLCPHRTGTAETVSEKAESVCAVSERAVLVGIGVPGLPRQCRHSEKLSIQRKTM
jgi:hypothetical protein